MSRLHWLIKWVENYEILVLNPYRDKYTTGDFFLSILILLNKIICYELIAQTDPDTIVIK